MLEIVSVSAIPDRYDSVYDEDVGDLPSDSFLINGRGRYKANSAPLTMHRVKWGETYKFRIINTGFDDLFEVKVDCCSVIRGVWL